jgi:RNA polymerase sigma-70 factor (ECF subfamily)
VEEYEMALVRYVGRLLGPDAAEVDDVVQGAFLRFHHQVQRRGRHSIGRVSSWLFRVAHNLAMDAGRRRGKHRRIQETVMNDPVMNPVEQSTASDPASVLGHREACDLAVAELDRLPVEQRTVLLLKVMQGFTLREISEVTGLKIGTVNYRLTQGLRELSRRLKQAGAI